jgi:hypothetical protein
MKEIHIVIILFIIIIILLLGENMREGNDLLCLQDEAIEHILETVGILDHWTRAIVRYSEQHEIVNGVQKFGSPEHYTIARTNSMELSTTREATSCVAI